MSVRCHHNEFCEPIFFSCALLFYCIKSNMHSKFEDNPTSLTIFSSEFSIKKIFFSRQMSVRCCKNELYEAIFFSFATSFCFIKSTMHSKFEDNLTSLNIFSSKFSINKIFFLRQMSVQCCENELYKRIFFSITASFCFIKSTMHSKFGIIPTSIFGFFYNRKNFFLICHSAVG